MIQPTCNMYYLVPTYYTFMLYFVLTPYELQGLHTSVEFQIEIQNAVAAAQNLFDMNKDHIHKECND